MAIVILLSVTVYHTYSNKLAIKINQTLALFKTLALVVLSIIGLAFLRDNRSKDHWIGIFNNTPSDDVHERSVSEQIGCYGYAMIEVLFSYEGWNNLNYLTPELDSPERRLKVSSILSVITSSILYFLMNIAYITVVDPKSAINSQDIIAISFGNTLSGELGKTIISILISISAFGSVGAMVFMGSRAITYAAKYKFIPKISEKLYHWNDTNDIPKYALLLQFVYCAIIILFAPVGKSFFPFFSSMSQYLAMVFFGISSVCLLIVKRRLSSAEYNKFKVHYSIIILYLLCIVFIAVAPFFPIPQSEYAVLNYQSYMPYVISWIAVFVGVSTWYLYDYKKYVSNNS